MTSSEYNPLVSVIVPTYNCAEYIDETLRSIINQSYKNIEVLVIDDGSTDATSDIVGRYILVDPRINYFWKQNGGQPTARNMGIKQAQGDLIAFCDSDDLWKPNKLSLQIQLFNDSSIGVCYTDAEIFSSVTGDISSFPRNNYFAFCRGIILSDLLKFNFVVHSSIVVRKTCFDVAGYFDETIKMGDDWDMLLRLATYFEFDYCYDKLVSYRIARNGQISSNLIRRFESNRIIFDNYINKHPGVVTKEAINKARSIYFIEYAWFLRPVDIKQSIRCYLLAIKFKPTNLSNYLYLFKSFLLFLNSIFKK